MGRKKRNGKEFVGAYVDPRLLAALEAEARAQHRTVTQQLVVILKDRYDLDIEFRDETAAGQQARRARERARRRPLLSSHLSKTGGG